MRRFAGVIAAAALAAAIAPAALAGPVEDLQNDPPSGPGVGSPPSAPTVEPPPGTPMPQDVARCALYCRHADDALRTVEDDTGHKISPAAPNPGFIPLHLLYQRPGQGETEVGGVGTIKDGGIDLNDGTRIRPGVPKPEHLPLHLLYSRPGGEEESDEEQSGDSGS